MTRFADCFWGSDFTSTAGFDNLCKRLRDGKQTCQDFEEFMKQRADVEEKYGKGLIRLARMAEGKDEIGSLKSSWDSLRTETENVGKLHLQLSQQLLDDLDRAMREFRETQKNKRKQVEENVKRAQKMKKTHYDNTIRFKKTYEQRCKEHDTTDEALKRSVSVASKDEEKLRSKLGKAKTAVEQADTAYQNSVRSLEEARISWEHEMGICCNIFQELEEERIAYLRNEMWVYANLGSITCVKEDEIYEEIRKSLENCDVDMDIQLFVSTKRTGSERPAPIDYENYYMTQSSQKTTGVASMPRDASKMQRRPPAALPTIPTAEDEDPLDVYSTVSSFRGNPAYQKPHGQGQVRQKEKTCTALFDYEAQGDQELTFKANDVIKVLFREGDVWCCGELRGQKGMFPFNFVKMNN